VSTLIVKFLKNLLFKDVTEAGQSDKDKPFFEKKRYLGAIGALATTFLGYAGYQFDPTQVVQLADAVNQLVIAGKQIVDIGKQSWPVVLAIYTILLGIVGMFDKSSREKIAKVLGEIKPTEIKVTNITYPDEH